MKKASKFIFQFIKKLDHDDIINQAAVLTYYLVMSFLPFLIFLVTLIGMLSLKSDFIINSVVSFFPSVTKSLVLENVDHIIAVSNPSLLSLSIVVCVWLASKCVRIISSNLDNALGIKNQQSYLIKAIISIFYTFIISIILIIVASIVFYTFLARSYTFLKFENMSIVKHFLLVFFIFFGLVFIYKYLPAKNPSYKQILPGAITSTAAAYLSYFIFSYYTTYIWQYNLLYGSLGTVIVFMFWLYIVSFILLAGGVLNSFIINYKKNNS